MLPGQILKEIMHIFDQFNNWKMSWNYRDILHQIEISWNIVCIVKKQYCSGVISILLIVLTRQQSCRYWFPCRSSDQLLAFAYVYLFHLFFYFFWRLPFDLSSYLLGNNLVALGSLAAAGTSKNPDDGQTGGGQSRAVHGLEESWF